MDYNEMVDTAPIARLVENIGAKSVFGEPTTENGRTIIPVAQVEYGFGYGGGYGSGDEMEAAGPVEGDPPGGGGGGGAGGRATPRGFIHIGPDGVTYEPIADDSRVALAGIFMAAWAIFWVTLTVRALIKAVARARSA